MGRGFAPGIASLEHRALVIAAIEERAARESISREEATSQVLDEVYEWRRRELAARWSPGDAALRVVAGAAIAAVRLIRRAVRSEPDTQAGGGREPDGR